MESLVMSSLSMSAEDVDRGACSIDRRARRGEAGVLLNDVSWRDRESTVVLPLNDRS